MCFGVLLLACREQFYVNGDDGLYRCTCALPETCCLSNVFHFAEWIPSDARQTTSLPSGTRETLNKMKALSKNADLPSPGNTTLKQTTTQHSINKKHMVNYRHVTATCICHQAQRWSLQLFRVFVSDAQQRYSLPSVCGDSRQSFICAEYFLVPLGK